MTGLSPQLLHELRSPLNQIIGYSELLTEEAGASRVESLTADLGKIRAAGHRMLALIEENLTETDKPHLVADRRSAPAGHHPPARVEHLVAPGVLLVVDDDSTNRDVLSRRLRKQGHTVLTAISGPAALELMRSKPFDLVLLDIMMPGMDGYEVLAAMKSDAALQLIPVIMISALSEVQSVVRCIEAGAEDYLSKPFDAILLKARIGACLEKKRARDRASLLFDQLQQNYKRLQELEKLRDDMRNMIVHDLRTPLTGVIVGVEMLEKYGALNEAQREMMTIALGGGRTLLGMINDLLDVEKMESGLTELLYEDLSADALVAGAIQQVAAIAEEGQTTLVATAGTAPRTFPGDGGKISRTLVNLIANAIRFTRGGTVTITVSQADETTTRFSILDTGQGIPPEAFERIFEKFGQLDPRSKVGTGLGLAFCKLAVEAHGGRIDVESKPGVGSIFSFTIPMMRP